MTPLIFSSRFITAQIVKTQPILPTIFSYLPTISRSLSSSTSHLESPLIQLDEQVTLALVKPDLAANPADLRAVKSLIVEQRFRILRESRLRLSIDEAHIFYGEHRKKFFFNRLVTYMTSGEIEAFVLAKPDAIAAWRRLMGPTKVLKAIYESPESVRARFGITDTRNATHGSDSVKNAQQEILFFFPDFFGERDDAKNA